MEIELQEVESIPVIPGQTYQMLDEKQRVHYRSHRENLIRWLLTIGKDARQGKECVPTTVRTRSQYTERFYRWGLGEVGAV